MPAWPGVGTVPVQLCPPDPRAAECVHASMHRAPLPECLTLNSRLLFLEGRTKGVGKVIRIFPIE